MHGEETEQEMNKGCKEKEESARGRRESMKSSDKFALPGLLPFKTCLTRTHTSRIYAGEKKLCYYYNNLLSLPDGFLICFTRRFQSQF